MLPMQYHPHPHQYDLDGDDDNEDEDEEVHPDGTSVGWQQRLLLALNISRDLQARVRTPCPTHKYINRETQTHNYANTNTQIRPT